MSPFEKSLHEAPEVSKIGIDIMKAEIPLSETGEHDLDAFIESLSDAVSGGHASQNLKISQATTSVCVYFLHSAGTYTSFHPTLNNVLAPKLYTKSLNCAFCSAIG